MPRLMGGTRGSKGAGGGGTSGALWPRALEDKPRRIADGLLGAFAAFGVAAPAGRVGIGIAAAAAAAGGGLSFSRGARGPVTKFNIFVATDVSI